MFAKLLTCMAGLVIIGATLLGLRQYRQTLRHDMATMHREMNEARKDVWRLHVRIAERIEPGRLKDAIERADLELEPVAATQPSTSDRTAAPSPPSPAHE